MGYVFGEILPWVLGALVVGFILGLVFWWCRWWFSGRRGTAERQFEELKTVSAAYETRAIELTGQLDRQQGEMAGVLANLRAAERARDEHREQIAALADVDVDGLQERIDQLEAENSELIGLRRRVDELEHQNTEIAGLRDRIRQLEGADIRISSSPASTPGEPGESTTENEDAPTAIATMEQRVIDLRDSASPSALVSSVVQPAPVLDLERAATILGSTIEVDDLTVVEGIGPKISELCRGTGITTWQQLAETPPHRLEEMLEEAGTRFRLHNPSTWPRQAELLADGRWQEYAELIEQLSGGRRKT